MIEQLVKELLLFGYVPSENKGHCDPCGVQQLREGFLNPITYETCQRIAEAATRRNKGEITDEEFEMFKSSEKLLLDSWTPMSTPRGNRRSNKEAIPNGLVMADLDHLDDPVGVYERCVRRMAEEGIVRLVHLTPSTSSDRTTGGLRIIFRQPEGMDIVQAQAWFYDQLSDVPEECKDKHVKDFARISFFTPPSYILFPENGVDGLEEAFADITPVSVTTPPEHVAASVTAVPEHTSSSTTATADDLPQEYMHTPYVDIVNALISKLGGTPQPGQRNTRVHSLAVNLRAITDNDEALLCSIIPNFGLPEEEWRKTIHSACRSDYPPLVTRLTRQVLSELNPDVEVPELPMPTKLPKLIKLILEPIPELYRPAVANAVFPAFATYLYHVSFDYINGCTHEPALMHLLIAQTSVGKSCIKDPIEHITARIRARSVANRERVQEWKDKAVARSANERGPQRPKNVAVQYVRPDMTSASLIQLLHDADGRFLFSVMDELELFDKLKDQRASVVKAAFDCAEWGAERASTASPSLTPRMRYNWVASTTPGGARKYFSRNLTDGTLNRLNISTIPQQEIGAPMPRFGKITEKWDAKLAKYLDNLEAATGHVRCPQAERLAAALDKELKDIAVATNDRTYEGLSFRANGIGYRKAMVLWLANGRVWEKAIEDFVRWSVHYDLSCKYRFFGEAIARAEAEDNACIGRRGPVNFIAELPETFTVDDLLRKRAEAGQPTDAHHAKDQIGQWMRRGLVERGTDPGTYVRCRRR